MTVDDSAVQLQLYARAPAPSRDYYGLTITRAKIILNVWNISYGPHVYPKKFVSTLDEFSEHRYMQHDIERTFGVHALEFARSYAAGERNLQYLPTKIFLRILRYLSTNDILRLSQTSKIFFDICNSEAVWKLIYGYKVKRRVPIGEMDRAAELGWKNALKSKVTTMSSLRNLLDRNETNKSKLNNAFNNSNASKTNLRQSKTNETTKCISKSDVRLINSADYSSIDGKTHATSARIQRRDSNEHLTVTRNKLFPSLTNLKLNASTTKIKNGVDGGKNGKIIEKDINLKNSKNLAVRTSAGKKL